MAKWNKSQNYKLRKKIENNKKKQVEDIANVCLFLASDMSSYVSGQVIQIDGGMNM
jgi:3-oxoacyl-[acyl-carrier protein] reductase